MEVPLSLHHALTLQFAGVPLKSHRPSYILGFLKAETLIYLFLASQPTPGAENPQEVFPSNESD